MRSRKVKYLGVWVDDKLTWSEHIAVVRRKCFGGLAKLRRLRDALPVDTKKKLYNALVLPILDYCSVVWQECRKDLQQKVERIQNYGMRLILAKPPRTPSAELRRQLKWLSLSERRELFRLVTVHRCLSQQAPRYLSESLMRNSERQYQQTRGRDKLYLRAVRSEIGRKSFSLKGAQAWNSLPAELRQVKTVETFKRHLKTHLFS